MTAPIEYTVKEAMDITLMEERQILYRIRKGHVDARKIGWIWIISEKGIDQLKGIKSSRRIRLPHGVDNVQEEMELTED